MRQPSDTRKGLGFDLNLSGPSQGCQHTSLALTICCDGTFVVPLQLLVWKFHLEVARRQRKFHLEVPHRQLRFVFFVKEFLKQELIKIYLIF